MKLLLLLLLLLLFWSFSTDTKSSELTFASHSTHWGFKSHYGDWSLWVRGFRSDVQIGLLGYLKNYFPPEFSN